MNSAGYLSEKFLSIVSPDISEALSQTTEELEKQLNEAQTAGTKVDYVSLTKTYYGRIDKSVTLAVPVFTTLLPNLPKMLKFAKARMGNFKGWKLTNKFKNINLPGKGTKVYKGMKSWFSKTSDYIKTAKNTVRNVVTAKYSKVLNVVKNLKEAIGVLSSYVFGAFNIYTIVQNFGRNDCKKLLDKARETHAEIVKANQTYNEILANVTEGKREMNKVKDDMLDQVTSDVFLHDLEAMKTNMVTIQGEGTGMQDMIDSANKFLDTANNNGREITPVLDAMTDLYEISIGTLPFIYNCLIERSALVGNVVRGCKEGTKNLDNVITMARTTLNYQPGECKKRTGIEYFTADELKHHVIKTAAEQNFNTECLLNNKNNLEWICDLKCQRQSCSGIAGKLGISDETAVQDVMNKCDLCEISENNKGLICFLLKSTKPEEIQQKFFKQFTVDQIKNVKCP